MSSPPIDEDNIFNFPMRSDQFSETGVPLEEAFGLDKDFSSADGPLFVPDPSLFEYFDLSQPYDLYGPQLAPGTTNAAVPASVSVVVPGTVTYPEPAAVAAAVPYAVPAAMPSAVPSDAPIAVAPQQAIMANGGIPDQDKSDTHHRHGLPTPAQSPESASAPYVASPGNKRKATGSPDDSPNEKRKKFLERNREAAKKCRQKKKNETDRLESRVMILEQENNRLIAAKKDYQDEVICLKDRLLLHSACANPGIDTQLQIMVGKVKKGRGRDGEPLKDKSSKKTKMQSSSSSSCSTSSSSCPKTPVPEVALFGFDTMPSDTE